MAAVALGCMTYSLFSNTPAPAVSKPFRWRNGLPRTAASPYASKPRRPRVAIVMDDLLYPPARYEVIFHVPVSLNFAVIPGFASSRADAARAHEIGQEVLVHMPMETHRHDMSRYTVRVMRAMNKPEIQLMIERAFHDVPYARGINNHVGSDATSDGRLMDKFMQCYRAVNREHRSERYFLDSRTIGNSRTQPYAREQHIVFYHRDVFLDGQIDPDYIRGQLRLLVTIARAHGSAVGIGHVRKETMEVLARELPKLQTEVEFVHLSDLPAENAVSLAHQ